MYTKLLGVGEDPQWCWVRGQFNEGCLPANIRLIDHWLDGCLSAPAHDGFRRGVRNTKENPMDVVVPEDEIRLAVREAFGCLFTRERGETLTVHLKGSNAISGVVGAASDGIVHVKQADGVDSPVSYDRIANVTKAGQPVQNP